MLIRFSVKNFKSYRDMAEFSMVPAAGPLSSHSNCYPLTIKGVPSLLKTAAVYGPNAGGKSNLLTAINLFVSIVRRSASDPVSKKLPFAPFALNQAARKSPIEFEAEFIVAGVRYQYCFSTVFNRIETERLQVYNTVKPSLVFDRKYDGTSQSDLYVFGNSLSGPKRTWQLSTRQNALFLSTAAQLNSELLGQIAKYLADAWCFGSGHAPDFQFTVDFMRQDNNARRVLALLQSADTGIQSVSFQKQKGAEIRFQLNEELGETASEVTEVERDLPVFTHGNGEDSAEIEFHDESDGTQKLFGLAGIFLEILEKGQVVFVDELDRSLHPLLVRRIVEMFNSSESNPKGAQLVFTTHDTTLLDPELLRRDQIWFVEKNREQASVLYSLSDISVRKNEAFAKGYLSGRYGALPVLDKFMPLGL